MNLVIIIVNIFMLLSFMCCIIVVLIFNLYIIREGYVISGMGMGECLYVNSYNVLRLGIK